MTEQQPSGTDCATALANMFFFLDHELAKADEDEIQRHLADCTPCLRKYDLERTVKTLVARSCTERAPEALRERVLVQIRQVHIEITERPGT
ncbi:mycothiol system anti-sigma-R factor [Nocardioides caldifontis]|uniref:mycothiol system anti-sigma-R factor n=1 Tax=Nocardioides caldifontis TaxID=2588938 RepID=UPI0011DF7905|nr:mycothiol system anti-sigma-R factor [Nocardioides caldifontis]